MPLVLPGRAPPVSHHAPPAGPAVRAHLAAVPAQPRHAAGRHDPRDYVIRKFGGEDRARRLYASITEIGDTEGVSFRFDRIRRTPSSVDAHRLVRWAAPMGRATEVAEALFAAHFTDGHDIGDHAVLRAIAASCGLDPVAAGAFLRSEEDIDAVHADNLRAHRLGINGVPASSSPAGTPSPAPRSRT